jgi:hypothetical protein
LERYVRVGILYSTEKATIVELAGSLRRGIEEQGNEATLYPDSADTFSGLAACRLLFVGTYAPTMFKVHTPSRLKEALNKAGGLVGKRTIAFTPDAGARGTKALLALMADMERQGCIVVDQIVLKSEKEAFQYSSALKLK